MRPQLAAFCMLTALLCAASPIAAKDSLGVFADWGAFHDPEVPRCYAIAAAQSSNSAREQEPFASVGTWPSRQVRGQLHFRLSRQLRADATINLVIGSRRFELTGSNGDAWAQDRQMDAAIIAAMRSASTMSISASDQQSRRFTDRYSLEGAATAMDAASVGCAQSG